MTQNLTEYDVLKALKQFVEPDLKRDVIALDLIHDLRVSDGAVSFRIILPLPLFPDKREFCQQIRQAISTLSGVKSVEMTMGFDIPEARAVQGKPAIPGIKNIIAVSSGKGGVGKSTVAVNLAVALAQAGAQVGLMDTDIYGPNIPIMMGINEQPLVRDNGKIGPLEAHGVELMSIGFLNRGDKPVIWRGPMLDAAVNQFLNDVDWSELDYLVVDMPPGTGDVQLSLAQRAAVTGAVLVTTPQDVSLADVRKAAQMFVDMEIPLLGIVENMSSFICDGCESEFDLFGHGGGEKLARRYETSLLAQIPLTTELRIGGDRGVPIVVAAPSSVAAMALQRAAEQVAAQLGLLSAGRTMTV